MCKHRALLANCLGKPYPLPDPVNTGRELEDFLKDNLDYSVEDIYHGMTKFRVRVSKHREDSVDLMLYASGDTIMDAVREAYRVLEAEDA